MSMNYIRLLYDPSGKMFRQDRQDSPFPEYAVGNQLDLNGPQAGAYQILEVRHTETAGDTAPGSQRPRDHAVHVMVVFLPRK